MTDFHTRQLGTNGRGDIDPKLSDRYLQCNCGNLISKRGEVKCVKCRPEFHPHGEGCVCSECFIERNPTGRIINEARNVAVAPDGSLTAVDNWKHRSQGMKCATCMWFVPKTRGEYKPGEIDPGVGRCRRRAPTMNGWPVQYRTDWCGDHKIDEEKI